jgi:putative hemolysin
MIGRTMIGRRTAGRAAMGARGTATALALVAALMGCGDGATDEGDVGLPNPASEHCVERDGRLDIRDDGEGDQYGVCVFEDGSECEEWAFYRDECEPGGSSAPPSEQRPRAPTGTY